MGKWDDFKDFLPHTQAPFNKRNWGNGIHSLCSYYGKLKPSLAHHLVEAFSDEGDKVLDIFCGSGTVLFESVNKGRLGFGFDINPISVAITSGKCRVHDPKVIENILNELEEFIQTYKPTQYEISKASDFGFNKTLKEYYEPKTFIEILSARAYFSLKRNVSNENDLIIACLLHILHGNRPYALSRRSHPITPYAPSGDFEYKSLMRNLKVKVYKSLNQLSHEHLSVSKIYQQNVLEKWPESINEIDLILTSPPFFDSTKYYLANWIRNWFLGWEKEDFQIEKDRFLDTIQKTNMDIYEEIFRNCKDVLSPKGKVIFHLGKSRKLDMGSELLPRAKKFFTSVELFNEDVSKVESHGVSDKGNVSVHQYLVMQSN